MKFVGLLLRIYSYLFHFLSSLFLLAVALVATFSHQPLNLNMLPFDSSKMLGGTYLLGVCGLVAVFLALTRNFKYGFPIWAAGTVYFLAQGFFFSSYAFHGTGDFKAAIGYLVAAFFAMIGAFWTLKPRRGRLYS